MAKPFHQILGESSSCPLAELGATVRFHSITDSNYHLQAVVLRVITLAAIRGSYPEFPDN